MRKVVTLEQLQAAAIASRAKRVKFEEDSREKELRKKKDIAIHNAPRKHGKDLKLNSKYGLSEEDYYSMLKQQNGGCAICKDKLLKPYIDHDHGSNQVRGLLCFSCNLGIGHLKESTRILKAAVKYLKKHDPLEKLLKEV